MQKGTCVTGLLATVMFTGLLGCAAIPRSVATDISTNADAVVIERYDERGNVLHKETKRYTRTQDIERGMNFISRTPAQMMPCEYSGKLIFVDSDPERKILEGKYCLDSGYIVVSDGFSVKSRKLSKDGMAFLTSLESEQTTAPSPPPETEETEAPLEEDILARNDPTL